MSSKLTLLVQLADFVQRGVAGGNGHFDELRHGVWCRFKYGDFHDRVGEVFGAFLRLLERFNRPVCGFFFSDEEQAVISDTSPKTNSSFACMGRV